MNKKGVSLLELIIVIAIIGIMTSVGLVSFNNNRDKKAVEVAAREIVAVLRQAQNDAIAGKQDTNSAMIECGYGIHVSGGAETYQLYYNSGIDCSSVGSAFISGSSTATNLALKNGVKFEAGQDVTIYYKIPRGDVYDASGEMATFGKIKIIKNSSSNDYYVCACKTGKIKENERESQCNASCGY